MTAPRTTTLNSMGDDVLGAIFLLLPPKDRAGPVARVCRRWHRITAHASMWPMLRLTPQDISVVAWLRQRSSGLRHLTLQARGATHPHVTLALAATAPLAMQLQHLQLVATEVMTHPFDTAELACISHLHGLTSLQVADIETPFEPANLDSMLACLPALVIVGLEFHEPSERDFDPIPQNAFPRNLLRCTRLTCLDFNASYIWPQACSVPAGITALQRLQHLGLRNTVTAPLPCSLSQLTCLTSLDVTQDEYDYGHRMFDSRSGPVPLPPSLRVLDASMAPVESFRQLTALQHLGLTIITTVLSEPSHLGMLGQLTSLQLAFADFTDWSIFEGCTGLRALHLGSLEMEEPQPLRFQQLTRLQLENSRMAASNTLIVISEMPQLEVLEVLDTTDPGFELLNFDVAALSRLPKLRLVDLSGSLLWDDASGHEAVHGNNVQKYLPLRVEQHLMCLQRANPDIEWVLGRNMGH